MAMASHICLVRFVTAAIVIVASISTLQMVSACAPLSFLLSTSISDQSAQVVHVIAPSGKPSSPNPNEVLPQIRNYISSHGLVPLLRDDVFSSHDVEPIYANTDAYRAADLIDALADNSSVIWCIRGGEGTARLIPYLELHFDIKHAKQLSPKLLIGFSDITVLHTYLIKKFGWSTLHGGMLSQIVGGDLDSESVSALWDVILNRKHELEYNIECLNDICKNSTDILTSSVVGGCMTLLQTSIGTAWQIVTTGKLVLLEDINEPPYKVERMLDHLSQAGLFTNARGVLLADLLQSNDEPLLNFVLQRFADSHASIPVYRLHGVGHARRNIPVPLNTRARVEYVDQLKRILIIDVPQTDMSNFII